MAVCVHRSLRTAAVLIDPPGGSGPGSAHLLAGSFWRHIVISFRNDFPYFLSSSLSSTPVSRLGGSFWRVSIKTFKRQTDVKIPAQRRQQGVQNPFSLSGIGRRAHLHGRVAVIGGRACGQLYSCDSKTPNICFKVVASNLRQHQRDHFMAERLTLALCSPEEGCTCSITSGAIQHGVPTKVFRTLFLVMSPPVARNELTPKSEKTLLIQDVSFISIWYLELHCRNQPVNLTN